MKAKFKVGEEVVMQFRIVKVDRRTKPIRYTVMAVAEGWMLDSSVSEEELQPKVKP